ncbi:MAG: hypothetical protein ACI4GY_09180 [Acutalibacteraceae bacterium]
MKKLTAAILSLVTVLTVLFSAPTAFAAEIEYKTDKNSRSIYYVKNNEVTVCGFNYRNDFFADEDEFDGAKSGYIWRIPSKIEGKKVTSFAFDPDVSKKVNSFRNDYCMSFTVIEFPETIKKISSNIKKLFFVSDPIDGDDYPLLFICPKNSYSHKYVKENKLDYLVKSDGVIIGSIEKSFDSFNNYYKVKFSGSTVYKGDTAIPKIKITSIDEKETLKEGVHYTVISTKVQKNSKEVGGRTIAYTIKGKGNLKGTVVRYKVEVLQPEPVANCNADSINLRSVKITWKNADEYHYRPAGSVTYYDIYRGVRKFETQLGKDGIQVKVKCIDVEPLHLIASVKGQSSTSYIDKDILMPDLEYRYYVRPRKVFEGKSYRADFENSMCLYVKFKIPQIYPLWETEPGKVMLSWKKVDGATGYDVLRADKEDGEYKLLTKIKGAKNNSFIDNNIETNKPYYYKILAKKYIDGKYYYFEPELSTTEEAVTKVVQKEINKLNFKSAENLSGKKVELKWKKQPGVSGYEIFANEGLANSKYYKIKDIQDANVTSYINYYVKIKPDDSVVSKRLEVGDHAFYKIRAYKLVDGKKVYGDLSDYIRVDIKK